MVEHYRSLLCCVESSDGHEHFFFYDEQRLDMTMNADVNVDVNECTG